jgi:hypothetical protein
MKTVRITLALAALLVGAMGGTSADLRAEGNRQCYRRAIAPDDACEACLNTCGGAGFLCCTIIVG